MFNMFDMYRYQGGGTICESFKKMSNIVKYKGKTYFVDTANTPDHGLETMIFKSKKQEITDDIKKINEKLINFADLYTEHYQSEADAIEGHNRIITHVGEYVEWDNGGE